MTLTLSGSKIAILATDGIERPDLRELLDELTREGAEVDTVAPDARAENYDAIVLSSGTAKLDHLRIVEQSMGFVRDFFDVRRPTAVICHGPWTMIEAGSDADVGLTAWPSFKALGESSVDGRDFDDLPGFRGRMN